MLLCVTWALSLAGGAGAADLGADVAHAMGTSTVSAQLTAPSSIAGTVTDMDSQALAGIEVELSTAPEDAADWSATAWAYTDANGHYLFDGLSAGTYRVCFYDWFGGVYAQECYNDRITVDQADDVAVAIGAAVSGIDAELGFPGSIVGVVTDASGALRTGILVEASPSDGDAELGADTTDATGSYEIGGLTPAFYRVCFYGDVYGLGWNSDLGCVDQVEVQAELATPVDFEIYLAELDAYEPDNARAQAKSIRTGAVQERTLYRPTGEDEDWASFNLPGPSAIRIEAVAAHTSPRLTLFDPDEVIVADSTAALVQGLGYRSRIERTCANDSRLSAGTSHVRVSPSWTDGDPRYSLSLTTAPCNPDTDSDGDGAFNDVDNCIFDPNPDQTDLDEDGVGAACDPDDSDLDQDGLVGEDDNCPSAWNPAQSDRDGDGMGDACDDDIDGDGRFNEDDATPYHDGPVPPVLLVDDDDDAPDVRGAYSSILDELGIVYDVWSTQGSDDEPPSEFLTAYPLIVWFTGGAFGGTAGPGESGEAALGTALDEGTCLLLSSQDYHFDKGLTGFMSRYLGAAEIEDDVEQQTVEGAGPILGLGPFELEYPFLDFSDTIQPDSTAQLAFIGNNGDAGIAKETATYRAAFFGFPLEALRAEDRAAVIQSLLQFCDTEIPLTDPDEDAVVGRDDNCPLVMNPDQVDTDADAKGDLCDDDDDNDGSLDVDDNCPLIANPAQEDNEADGLGDVCDDDDDNDGVLDSADNCPLVENPSQEDNDLDGIGDICDDDDDNDTVADPADNCPLTENADQADTDTDGFGDLCDDDDDNDGRVDEEDNCPLVANADQADADRDGVGDLCDDTPDFCHACLPSRGGWRAILGQ